jgi:hypothetical protein
MAKGEVTNEVSVWEKGLGVTKEQFRDVILGGGDVVQAVGASDFCSNLLS